MKDAYGRTIDYLRISITDRCNLRCCYCYQEDYMAVRHDELLSFEELLIICGVAVSLGITHFKVTGGEPLVRKGCVDFLAQLKQLPGVESVSLTTNGTLLSEYLPSLSQLGIDGINISLDTLEPILFYRLTGCDFGRELPKKIENGVESGIPIKLNTVMLWENETEYIPLLEFAQRLGIEIRYIELMPIGLGTLMHGPTIDKLLAKLMLRYPDLHRSVKRYGNGPAIYYESEMLKKSVGFIGANSHSFCLSCNRIRLTSTGKLKSCLCYSSNIDLRAIIRSGGSKKQIEAAIKKTIEEAIQTKPQSHDFGRMQMITEAGTMNEIGG